MVKVIIGWRYALRGNHARERKEAYLFMNVEELKPLPKFPSTEGLKLASRWSWLLGENGRN